MQHTIDAIRFPEVPDWFDLLLGRWEIDLGGKRQTVKAGKVYVMRPCVVVGEREVTWLPRRWRGWLMFEPGGRFSAEDDVSFRLRNPVQAT